MFLLSATEGNDVISLVLLIAIIIVSGLIGIATIVALVLKIKIFFSYWITNRERAAGGYTGETAALKLLGELGYDDIAVKETSFFGALLYGNHYNPKRKTVYLRYTTLHGAHLTAVGLALQKVGIVIQDKRDGDAVKKRWKLQKLAIFGPIFFIPIVVVGLILDLVTMILTDGSFTGIGTFVCAILGVAFFIASFVLSILNIKVERKANRETLEILKNHDFLSPYEQSKVEKVFKTYLYSYIVDFLISILEIVRFVLKIVYNIFSRKNRN